MVYRCQMNPIGKIFVTDFGKTVLKRVMSQMTTHDYIIFIFIPEELSVNDLRSTLDWLVELAICPVCHETLASKVVMCVTGHLVCVSCRQRLQKPECPLCSRAFSNVQPTWFVQQVIEALPHPCRYKNCDYFVKTKDDHEKHCTYKPTKCRYCNWSGAGKEIVDHLQSTHKEAAEKYLSVLRGSQNGVPFNPKRECSAFTPIFVDGHFFWGEMKNEPVAGKLTAIFHPVPNGKIKTVFKGSLKLDNGSYAAELTINMEPDADPYVENSISIPISKLDKCTVDNKFLYIISIDQIYTLHSVTTSLTSMVSGIMQSKNEVPGIIWSKIELLNQRLKQ